MQITSANLQVLLCLILLPGLGDIGEFPGRLVQPGETMLGPDNQLILFGLVGDVGGDARVCTISRRRVRVGSLDVYCSWSSRATH